MDDKIIDFADAKAPHVHQRKEDRVKAMRQAFKDAREAARPTTKGSARKSKKKGKRKK